MGEAWEVNAAAGREGWTGRRVKMQRQAGGKGRVLSVSLIRAKGF